MPFSDFLRAGFPALWVLTSEPARAEYALSADVPQGKRFRWDARDGVLDLDTGQPAPSQNKGPSGAIDWLLKSPEGVTLFLWNLHRAIDSLDVIQAIQNVVPDLKQARKHIVALTPVAKIPIELARVFTLYDFKLPTPSEMKDILLQTMPQLVEMDAADVDSAMEAARGLTVSEAEDALSLSLVTTKRLDPVVIAAVKTTALMRHTSLQVSVWTERFEHLGGLDVLKPYLLRTAPHDLALGALLLGPPGTGKSSIAKALGNELGRPTVSLDFGRMMGSLLGESEQRIREALDAVDALGKCILFIDEIEKGLEGVESSGQTDGGARAGVGSTFLKWMSDRPKGQAYVIATCNNITKLPPAYARAERWDALFFIEMPNQKERRVIWDIYKARYQVSGDVAKVDDHDWTGAEIHTCCRQAAMHGVPIEEAQVYVTPVARTHEVEIKTLRDWAKGCTIMASTPEDQPSVRNGYLKPRNIRRTA